jgi:uncharacterized protein (TIGR02118 family)
MFKLTVVYGHPTDPASFESYYTEVHRPLVVQIPNVEKIEYTKFLMSPTGGTPAFYRMAEIYFNSQAALEEGLNSPEGKATADDLANFATGGVQMVVGVELT